VDYQCSLYNQEGTSVSYLQLLREASLGGSIYDYYSQSELSVNSLDAVQMIRVMQTRTILNVAVMPTFNDICKGIYNLQPEAQQHFKSYFGLRDWALDIFRGEGWLGKKDLFGILFSRIAERLPRSSRRDIDAIPCHGFFTNDVSAYLISSPKGDVGIIIPWNLYFFIFYGCTYLFHYLNNFVQYTGGENKAKDRTIEQICDQCLHHISTASAWCCDSGPGLFRMPSLFSFNERYGTLLEKPQTDITIIVQSALSFILLHEIGHIQLRHINSSHYIPITLQSDEKLALYTTSTLQEDEADQFAITNYIRIVQDIIPGPTYLKLLGPPFVFVLYRLREAIFSRWKDLLESQLKKKGISSRTNQHRFSEENVVTTWNLEKKNASHLVELPSHPLTTARLNRIVGEIADYIQFSGKRDPMVGVIGALLSLIDSLVGDWYSQAAVEKRGDDDIASAVAPMIDQIRDSKVYVYNGLGFLDRSLRLKRPMPRSS